MPHLITDFVFEVLLAAVHITAVFISLVCVCAVERVADTVTEVPPEEVALPPAPEERIMDLVLGKMPSTTNSISSVTK